MMRNLIPILLTFASLVSSAQTVQVIADWSPGDVFRYNVTKIGQKNRVVDTLRYTMTMTVTDSTEAGYRIKMVYDGLYNNPAMDSLNKLMDDYFDSNVLDALQTVYYTTDNVGEILEVENADELIKNILDYSDALLKALGQDDDPEVNGFLKKLYTKESLLTGVYKEITYLHTALGYEWALNKPIEKKVKLDNVLTGGYFNAKTRVSVEEYDPESQYFRMRINTVVDDKQLKKAVTQLLSSVGMSKKELKGYRPLVVDDEVYECRAYPGIPLRVDYQRGTIVSSKEDIEGSMERYIITLVD